jgi:2-polyprenyl-3-methyl-5-hydroxy-6-metoxy-1,4-benzoquinol methylase
MMRICKVCLSGTLELKYFNTSDYLFGVKGIFNYSACTNCNSFQIDKEFTDVEISHFYKNYFTHESSVVALKNNNLKVLINKLLNKLYSYTLTRLLIDFLIPRYSRKRLFIDNSRNLKILDYGCGNGRQMITLKENGHDTIGLDFDLLALSSARKNGLNVKHVSDLTSNEKFDVISLLNVIEHLSAPENVIIQLGGNLNDQGLLIIETPNAQSFLSRKLMSKWRGLEVPRHLQVFSNEGLNILLERCGFKLTKVNRINAYKFYLAESNISSKEKQKYRLFYFFIWPILLFAPSLRETNLRVYNKISTTDVKRK